MAAGVDRLGGGIRSETQKRGRPAGGSRPLLALDGCNGALSTITLGSEIDDYAPAHTKLSRVPIDSFDPDRAMAENPDTLSGDRATAFRAWIGRIGAVIAAWAGKRSRAERIRLRMRALHGGVRLDLPGPHSCTAWPKAIAAGPATGPGVGGTLQERRVAKDPVL